MSILSGTAFVDVRAVRVAAVKSDARPVSSISSVCAVMDAIAAMMSMAAVVGYSICGGGITSVPEASSKIVIESLAVLTTPKNAVPRSTTVKLSAAVRGLLTIRVARSDSEDESDAILVNTAPLRTAVSTELNESEAVRARVANRAAESDKATESAADLISVRILVP